MKYNVGQTVMADTSRFKENFPVLGIIVQIDKSRIELSSRRYRIQFADDDDDWFSEIDVDYFMDCLKEYQGE